MDYHKWLEEMNRISQRVYGKNYEELCERRKEVIKQIYVEYGMSSM